MPPPSILVLGQGLTKIKSEVQVIKGLQALGNVRVEEDTPNVVKAMHQILKPCEILVVDPVPYVFICGQMMSGTSLRFITTTTSGFDHVDIKAANKQNILASNVPNYSCEAVAEHTFSLLLALFRKLLAADRQVRECKFDPFPFQGREIAGKTLGIIGLGSIGTRVAELAKAFGARVVAYDILPKQVPEVEMMPLRSLLEQSDIISLHASLNQTSVGIIGEEQLSWMKPDAVLINTARGRLIDEQALIVALQKQKLAGAALDVLSDEKSGQANPLFDLPNLIFSPHTAFFTVESMVQRDRMVIKNVQAYIKGTPINLIIE